MRSNAVEERVDDVRLHLGCGRKIRKGWVNVDISDFGQECVADLRKLPFPDNYADEIEAIHVIEHFEQWEAAPALAEWARVLKPGGAIRIECPDLLKMLSLVVGEAPYLTGDFLNFIRGGLYGDFPKKNPYMTHKWAFIDKELKNLMLDAGLKHVDIVAPVYHIPARDMAVVGIK